MNTTSERKGYRISTSAQKFLRVKRDKLLNCCMFCFRAPGDCDRVLAIPT